MERDTNKLPEPFKTNWLKALRSGEYTQCKNQLTDGEGYCCIGVAGIVAGHDPEKFIIDSIPVYNMIDELTGNNETKRKLWNMNDSQGKSFSEIADYIEANL